MIGVRTLARPLLASMFVVGGIDALMKPGPKVERARQSPLTVPHVEQLGLTTDERVIRANGGLMVVAGLALATGRAPRLASIALVASLAPTTVAGHPFWQEKDPVARKANMINFFKNLGLMGGLMLAAVDTDGRDSLPRRAGRLAHETKMSSKLLVKDAELKAVRARHTAASALPG